MGGLVSSGTWEKLFPEEVRFCYRLGKAKALKRCRQSGEMSGTGGSAATERWWGGSRSAGAKWGDTRLHK